MWQVMIESAMGIPQYFHGVDWSKWKSNEPIDKEFASDVSLARSQAAIARNKKRGEETRNKVLAAVMEIKQGYNADFRKATGLSESTIKGVMDNLYHEGILTREKHRTKYGIAFYFTLNNHG